jgi:hypothetical protein
MKELREKSSMEEIVKAVSEIDFGVHDIHMNLLDIDGEMHLELFQIALTGAYALKKYDQESASCLFEANQTPAFRALLGKYLGGQKA